MLWLHGVTFCFENNRVHVYNSTRSLISNWNCNKPFMFWMRQRTPCSPLDAHNSSCAHSPFNSHRIRQKKTLTSFNFLFSLTHTSLSSIFFFSNSFIIFILPHSISIYISYIHTCIKIIIRTFFLIYLPPQHIPTI